MSDGVAGLGRTAKLLALVAALALLILVALKLGGSPSGANAGAPTKSGALKLRSGAQLKASGVYAGGRRIRVRGAAARAAANGAPGAFSTPTAAPVLTPLLGYEAPAAVPSPDGRSVAYNTWRWTRPIDWRNSPSAQGLSNGDPIAAPELYVRDLSTGNDVSLGAGTMALAYRSDGAIAYARGDAVVRLSRGYACDILVRATPAAEAVAWTPEPGAYTPLAWAGDRLIAHRDIQGLEAHDVVALDGPGRLRTLAENAELVAVSPSGTRVVVSTGEPATGTTSSLLLLDVATGATFADVSVRSTVDPATGERLVFADDPGDWKGDELVLRTESGLMVLHATDELLAVRQVLHLDLGGIPLNEPRFVDEDRTVVEAWANLPEPRAASARYQCNRVTLVCSRGAPAPMASFARPAYDRSEGRGGQR
jgi:hypothetical protein